MKKMMKKTIAFFLVAAMMVMNLGAFVSAADAEGQKKEEDSVKVSAPEASIKAGTYKDTQKITLTSKTKDAVIYYTVNGDTPTVKSTKFDAKKPLEVKVTTTVKALAVKEGMDNSDVATFKYTIGESKETEKTPSKEEPKTPETPSEPVTKETPEEPKEEPKEPEKAPSEEGEATLEAPKTTTSVTGVKEDEKLGEDATTAIAKVEIKTNDTIKAGDTLADYNDATKYTVTCDPVDSCTLETITWTCTEAGVTTFEEGKSYNCKVGLKAIDGFSFSGDNMTFILNGVNSISPEVEPEFKKIHMGFGFTVPQAPTATPQTGTTVKNGDKITLTSDTPGATIKYTVGTETEEKDYTDGVTVAGDSNKKFDLSATAYLNRIASNKASFQYTVEEESPVPAKPEAPKASKEGGTYEGKQSITLTAEKPGDEIRYTLDGMTTPTATVGEVYKEAIEINESRTLMAVTVRNGVVSDVATYKYTITEKPEPPAVKYIEKIEITDLTVERGKKLDKKASVSSDSHSTVESVKWTDEDGNKVDGIFKADTVYHAYFSLKAKNGYEYVINKTEATAILNGRQKTKSTVNFKENNKKEITVLLAIRIPAGATAAASGNTITGVKSSYTKGSTVTFTATGATNPKEDGNERYIPVKYKISNSEFEIKDGKTSVQKAFKISSTGTFTLYVYFQKQVYNAETKEWENDGSAQDMKSVSFKVAAAAATPTKKPTATTAPKKTSTTSKSKNAKTGDETPIGAYAAMLLLAGGAIAFTVVRKRKKTN